MRQINDLLNDFVDLDGSLLHKKYQMYQRRALVTDM